MSLPNVSKYSFTDFSLHLKKYPSIPLKFQMRWVRALSKVYEGVNLSGKIPLYCNGCLTMESIVRIWINSARLSVSILGICLYIFKKWCQVPIALSKVNIRHLIFLSWKFSWPKDRISSNISNEKKVLTGVVMHG